MMDQEPKEIVPTDSPIPDPAELIPGKDEIVGPGQVDGDVIITGDISGSYIAIGRGAQVVVEQQIMIEIPPPPEPTRPTQLDQFVGRQAELNYFAGKLASHHLAVISGMAGVGKTALATTLAEIWQVWQMSALPAAGPSPDQASLETMAGLQVRAENSVFWHTFHEDEGIMAVIWQLAGFLAWHGRDELWRMLQSAQQSGGQSPPPATLFDYVLKLLQGQDYLLCLDDIQYVHDDPALPQFIDRLSESVRAGEVSLIITSREVPDYVRSVSFESLSGLTVADVGRLVEIRGLSLPASLVEQLYAHTEGNAELLTLAVNVLQEARSPEQVLDSLAEVDDIERYLIKEVDAQLSEAEQEIMITVAIMLGYPASREAIEAVAGWRRLKQLLRRLNDKHLLTIHEGEAGEAYSAHAMLRAFYYNVPSRRERRDLHRRAGEYYEEDEPDPLQAARHYERAGEPERAAQLVTPDIWPLINQGQAFALRRLLERLIVEEKLAAEMQIRVHLAHGQVCAFLSDSAPARQSFQAALSQLDRQPASDETRTLKARIYRGLGEALRYESPPDSLRWLKPGLAELGATEGLTESQRQEKAALYLAISTIQYEMGDYPATLHSLEQGLALLPPDASQLRAIALKNLGNMQDDLGQLAESQNSWQQGLAMATQLHDHFLRLAITKNMGIGHATASNWAEAIAKYQQAMALAEQVGSVIEQALIENAIGWLETNQGKEESALAHLSHSLELARRHNLRNHLSHVLSTLAVLQVRMQDWAAAESTLQEAEHMALETNTKHPFTEIYYSWAQVKLAQGQQQAALDYAEKALKVARDLGMDFEEGIALGVLGQVYLADNQIKRGLKLFEQSVTLLASRDPYQAARTKVVWGRYLVSTVSQDQELGMKLLQQAQATFLALGAKRDLAEVEEILNSDVKP
jgi:tetratricopeptide (TPR) repeat protein